MLVQNAGFVKVIYLGAVSNQKIQREARTARSGPDTAVEAKQEGRGGRILEVQREPQIDSLGLTHPSHCDKNVIKLFQTGKIIVINRTIVMHRSL